MPLSTIVSLTVDEHGNIIEQQVVKPLSPTLDAEALRVIQLYKDKLCPAMLNGKTYQSVLSIPISFRLG
jgi:outer membrane biosynthesis protein TonB